MCKDFVLTLKLKSKMCKHFRGCVTSVCFLCSVDGKLVCTAPLNNKVVQSALDKTEKKALRKDILETKGNIDKNNNKIEDRNELKQNKKD